MNFRIKEAVAVGVPYLIGVGACFQFGYWGAFHINVLEFISFADVAKLAVYPLMASLIFLLAGVLFSELVFSPHLPPGGGRTSKVGRFGHKYWRWLLALQLVITVLVGIYWPEPVKWFFVAGLVSTFSALFTHLEKNH